MFKNQLVQEICEFVVIMAIAAPLGMGLGMFVERVTGLDKICHKHCKK